MNYWSWKKGGFSQDMWTLQLRDRNFGTPLSNTPLQTQVSWMQVFLSPGKKKYTFCSQSKLLKTSDRSSWASLFRFYTSVLILPWMGILDSMRVFALDAPLLLSLSECWNHLRTVSVTLPEILLSCPLLALETHLPPPKTSPFTSSSLLSFLFLCLHQMDFFSSVFFRLFLYIPLGSSVELSWHPARSLYLCPSLRQWHMECVNCWAAGQPQIRYEHTAHEAQLFKRLSSIAHTSYTTSLAAETLINWSNSVC